LAYHQRNLLALQHRLSRCRVTTPTACAQACLASKWFVTVTARTVVVTDSLLTHSHCRRDHGSRVTTIMMTDEDHDDAHGNSRSYNSTPRRAFSIWHSLRKDGKNHPRSLNSYLPFDHVINASINERPATCRLSLSFGSRERERLPIAVAEVSVGVSQRDLDADFNGDLSRQKAREAPRPGTS
jgi:hypothetical protein